jgi:hypothetical protein
MAQLLSVNVGLPRDIEWKGKTVCTAVWKDAVQGRRKVGKLNIDGDGQGDVRSSCINGNQREERVRMPRKMARQTLDGSRPYLGSGVLGSPENRPTSEFIRGIPV